MSYQTIRFQEHKLGASKALPCPTCGKKVRRQRTFSETQNPYNRNADGDPKTVSEIYASLREKTAAWKEVPVMCAPCLDKADQDGAQTDG